MSSYTLQARHREITYDELSKSLPEVTVIDVRNRNELEMCGQIPGSHCIPVTEIKFACGLSPESFQARYGFPKPESNDALVVCCKTGVRSKTACDLLEAKGYNRHRIYRGSFTDWEEKGGDVIKPGQPYFCDCEDEDDNTNLKNAINQNQIKDSMIPGDQRFSDTDDDDDDKENIS